MPVFVLCFSSLWPWTIETVRLRAEPRQVSNELRFCVVVRLHRAEILLNFTYYSISTVQLSYSASYWTITLLCLKFIRLPYMRLYAFST